jgi:dTDP-4-amino-4,6-dideoxygalactose transaminase
LVHLFGNAADMDMLREISEDHNLLIASDSAQAHRTE